MQNIFLENETKNPFSRSLAPTEDFYVEFDNGASLNFDLCSGQHNYWDDVVWINADKTRDVILDCEYELDDIEVEIENELYIVKIIKG